MYVTYVSSDEAIACKKEDEADLIKYFFLNPNDRNIEDFNRTEQTDFPHFKVEIGEG